MSATHCSVSQVPPGFSLVNAPHGFVRHCGGFHLHEELPVLGVRIMPEHLNSVRIAHGGFLATFADTAFGLILRRCMQSETPPITVSLCADYLNGVREGDWLEAHVQVLKVGTSLVNADCLLKVGERTVLRCSGVFTRWRGRDTARD